MESLKSIVMQLGLPAPCRRGELGVIARKIDGNLCRDYAAPATGSSVEDLEAKAIMEGISLAISNKWQNVIIDSDAASIINHLCDTYHL